MKKIKAILVTLILFFCLGYSNTQANASQSVVDIFLEDEPRNTAVVLNSGYYIMGLIGRDIEDVIKGDYEYAYLYQNTEVFRQDFEYTIGCDDVYIDDLIERFNDEYGKTLMKNYGAYIFKVYSYAAFYTNEQLDYVTLVHLPTTTPNMNATIAGNMTHLVNVDHLLSLADIKARYTASDNVDGNITSRLQFETNYNPATATIGKYYILVSVKDSANHETFIADLIWVKDFTPPVISLSKSVHSIEVHTVFTSEDAKKFFSARDNYTASNKIRFEFEDNYKNQYNVLGQYTIKAKAYDAENNCSSEEVLTIQVKDTTKPVITLKEGGDTIIANHPLAESEIRALLNVTDNYFTLRSENITITHNCNGDQGKEFQITASIRDGEGNEGTAHFKYYLTDTIAPIIMVQKVLYIPVGSTYTNEQIIQMLRDAGILDINVASVSINSEIIPTSDEGIYQINYTETLLDGSTKDGCVMLNIFTPVESQIESTDKANPLWYTLLLIPVLLVGAGVIFFIYRFKKHEKD